MTEVGEGARSATPARRRTPHVVVLDYGSGNVHSAVKALALAGADVELTSKRRAVLAADGVLVPGVGAFAAVMQALDDFNAASLIDSRLRAGKPVLGICVGMQVMFTDGIEGGRDVRGLGYLPGTVVSLDTPTLPHIGWNTVEAPTRSALFHDIASTERFYFVHSFGVTETANNVEVFGSLPLMTRAEHEGQSFLAAIEAGPLTATQFHPEKSGPVGIKLLRNWLGTL